MNFIGVDLHKKSITVCVMDEKRKVLARKILACTQTNEIVDVETGTQLVIDSSCVPVSFPWPRRGSTRATRTRTRSWLMAAIPSPGNRSRGERGWKQRVWDLFPARGEPGRPGGQSLAVVTVWIRWHADGSFHFVTLKPWRNPRP